MILAATSGCGTGDTSASSPSLPPASSGAADTDATGPAGTSDGDAGSGEAPGGGTIDDVADDSESGGFEVQQPVELDESADVGDGLTVRLVGIDARRAQAIAPTDVEGPALAVTVSVTNSTPDVVDLESAFVNLADAEGTLAVPLTDGTAPLGGPLESGASSEGTYVFRIAKDTRDPITVYVSPTAGAPVAQFVGGQS